MDAILDAAGQEGHRPLDERHRHRSHVPLPTITAAVDARALSAARPWRPAASAAFPPAGPAADLTGRPKHALYAAKIMSYTQGFALLAAAAPPTTSAPTWPAWPASGRPAASSARFLDRVHAAFSADPGLPLPAARPGLPGRDRRSAPPPGAASWPPAPSPAGPSPP
ncbi:MAG: hypothetical protein R3F43_10180 [bacterium]